MKTEILSGVRIADFSMVWAGPYTTALLSFMGAEVIKIESRKHVDQTRKGSITTGDDFDGINYSPIFNNANLNKKSVSIDITTPEGVELAKKIVAVSDVVVENMRPGKMEKRGLGYKDLVKVKPDIIMLSASGFGSSGPYGAYAGYAPIFAAFGGLAYLTGYEDGEPNTMSGVMDLRVGTVSASAILAALIHRQKTGKGQYIDLSCSECVSTHVGSELLEYTMNGTSPGRNGNHDAMMAPHNCYRCKGDDKWISIAVGTDGEWSALCSVMGNPEWSQSKEYADQDSRLKNQQQLDKHISAWSVQHTHFELMERLQGAGVAAMPSFNAEELLSDPHSKARGIFTEVEHPKMGKKVVITPPWKFSETPAKIHKASPLLGADNEEVFGGILGMTKEEIGALSEAMVINLHETSDMTLRPADTGLRAPAREINRGGRILP
jgi:benzylsuccinate CoA-transferase BbsF subunit